MGSTEKENNPEFMNRQLQVEAVLNTLLPAMEADGGGIEMFEIEGDSVKIKLKGACLICPSIGMTMKYGITKALLEELPWVREVIRMK